MKTFGRITMFLGFGVLMSACQEDNRPDPMAPELAGSEYTIVMQGDFPVQVANNQPLQSGSFQGARLGPSLSAPATGSFCTVQSFDAGRTGGAWGMTEGYLSDTRSYLLNAANFGAGGVVPGGITIGAGIPSASAATLTGADVFFTGYVRTSSYTAAEKQAIYDFVLAGGVVIGTTDSPSYTMVDIFGVTQGPNSLSGQAVSNVTNASHPIATGPFGVVSTYEQYFAIGHYSALGPNAVEVGANAAGTSIAVIEEGALGPGSGRVILVADVDVFSNESLNPNPGGGSIVNEALIKNIFAYACGPVSADIDIKPGSFPNSINTKNKGVIPVAVLGSAAFDVTTIDGGTLTFGPAHATPAHAEFGHLEDVNQDGFMDLVSHYKTQDTGLAQGDTEACVSGATTLGAEFEGCDSVRIVK